MKILITGCAGFIGYHLAKKLILKNIKVIGVDNINKYYDTKLKIARLKDLYKINKKCFSFFKVDIHNQKKFENIFKKNKKVTHVVNLAAQAGVRYSISNPQSYVNSNLVGFANVLENCKNYKIKNLIFASTSSVYGANKKMPYKESDNTDTPIQFYAATKKSNEVMAHSYSHLYKIQTIGLRFFTVYGPWGRPDMALFKFTKNILAGKKIDIYNYGNHSRDFTYIDDIIDSIFILIKRKRKIFNKKTSFEILNIGKGHSDKLIDYISLIESYLNKKSKRHFLKLQTGDIVKTLANTKKLKRITKKRNFTPIHVGVKKFVTWYLEYFKINKI